MTQLYVWFADIQNRIYVLLDWEATDLTVLCEIMKSLPNVYQWFYLFYLLSHPNCLKEESCSVESAFRPAQEWIYKPFQKLEHLLVSSQWILS